MATLQKIRSKGPLLIIVIGLALFAFIAGDAWKVLQPHQTQDVGEVNGTTLSAQEYQAMVEEYSELVKVSSNMNALTDEQTNQIKDDVWRTYVNNRLIEDEAQKIGLVVSDAEVQAIIDAGTHPMLQSTPFQNPQTGAFDKDVLKKVLVDYANMKAQNQPSQNLEYYEIMNRFWLFIERNLRQSRLAEKYQALIVKSMSSNPVEAQVAYEGRVNQMDVLLATVPYSHVPDSLIKVKNSEVKALYNKTKEKFRQRVETRDIKYIDVQVVASPEDRRDIENEVIEYTDQLRESESDYTAIVRSSGSEYPYVDLYYTKEAYPVDVIARLDSVAIGEVFGPYFNAADNTLNSFKKIERRMLADSIQFRQIQVYNDDIAKTRVSADSIYTALKGGANFVDLASSYGQNGESVWIALSSLENAQMDNDNLKLISSISMANVNEVMNVSVGVANIVIQVTNKKVMTDKYKVAVIKRPIVFSNETYNKAYNDFSQFIAANPTLDAINANAEDAGYRLYERANQVSAEHGIASIKGTKDALRWVFSAKPGEVSSLYECGDNDRLLAVALSGITKEGYRSVESAQSELWLEVVKEKKGDMIAAEMKALNATSIDQYKSMDNAMVDSVKHVTFSAPAYLTVARGSEPVVSAYASVAPLNQLGEPIKGNFGVLAMQVYAKENIDDSFDVEREKESLKSMHERMMSSFMGELYIKAKVKDTRYLFF